MVAELEIESKIREYEPLMLPLHYSAKNFPIIFLSREMLVYFDKYIIAFLRYSKLSSKCHIHRLHLLHKSHLKVLLL